MATSLASLRKTAPKAHPLALFYGVGKVGKTSLACQAPGTILIQTLGENPPAEVDVDTFGETTDIDTFMEHIEALLMDDHSFKTLVIDSADGLQTMVNTYVCKERGWDSIETPGFGKGFTAAEDFWSQEIIPRLLELRDRLGMNIIIIAHAEVIRFDSPTSEAYARYRPNLRKSICDMIGDKCEIIGFINHRVSIVKEAKTGPGAAKVRGEGAGIRIAYFDERPGFIAGNRYSMPTEITIAKGKGWAEIAKYLPKAEAA